MKVFYTILLSLAFSASFPAVAYSDCQKDISYTTKQNTSPEVEISVIGNRLKVENATVGNKLEIYSVVGVKVLEIEIKQTSGEYTLNIAKGYYIVRINETVRKIVIR